MDIKTATKQLAAAERAASRAVKRYEENSTRSTRDMLNVAAYNLVQSQRTYDLLLQEVGIHTTQEGETIVDLTNDTLLDNPEYAEWAHDLDQQAIEAMENDPTFGEK